MKTQDHREEEVKITEPIPEIQSEDMEQSHVCENFEQTDRLITGDEINDLVVAAQVESRLRSIYPCEVVTFNDGVVTVDVEAPLLQEPRLVEEFNNAACSIPGVKQILVHIVPESIHGMG